MIRREPRKTRPVRYFAEQFGVSAKTIKRLADKYGWKQIRYTDAPTATIYLFEKQVNEFFLEKQNA